MLSAATGPGMLARLLGFSLGFADVASEPC